MVQTVYQISFVGADDSVRPQNSAISRAPIGPGGKSKTGGRGPLLGRFKGIAKGEIEIPLCRFPFHRQRPFPLPRKGKGG